MTTLEEFKIEIGKLIEALNGLSLGEILKNKEELADEMRKLSIIIVDFNTIFHAPRKNMELSYSKRDENTCKEKIIELFIEHKRSFTVKELCALLGKNEQYIGRVLNELEYEERVKRFKDRINKQKYQWRLIETFK